MPYEDMAQHRPADILRDTDRDSFGVVRVLASPAGTPGEEREYESGDEALVEAGLAEWVVAPVHAPSAGRRLDGDAECEPNPIGGIEAFPVAGPTDPGRRAQARADGFAKAHIDEGLGGKLAARRAEVARDLAGAEAGDAELQASLGSLGARSGPVTKPSELPADKALSAAATATGDAERAEQSQGDPKVDPRAALGRQQGAQGAQSPKAPGR
jgi:hypothetical protein